MRVSFCCLSRVLLVITIWLVTLNPLPHSQILIFHHSIHETAKASSINKTSLWGSKSVSDKNRNIYKM